MEAMTAPTGRKMVLPDRPDRRPGVRLALLQTKLPGHLHGTITVSQYRSLRGDALARPIYEKLYYTSAHYKKGGGIEGSHHLELIDPANADKNKRSVFPGFIQLKCR
jgi:hypothetical protein